VIHALKTYIDLFIGFFRSTMLGYGGGPSTIPLVHKEVVERFKWITDDDFADILALGNTLPGPIATKMAGYIGYRVAGVRGMLTALAATIIPTVIIMIGLLSFLYSFKDSPYVKGMTAAIKPVVAVMLLVIAYDFFKKSWQGQGWVVTALLGIISLAAFEWAGIHPAIVIGSLLAYAIIGPSKKAKKGADKEAKGGSS
jgi:chromate transporter